MYIKLLTCVSLLLTAISTHAGQWVYGKTVVRPEVRHGNSVSVIVSDTIPDGASANLCTSNRIHFQKDKWIDQEGVNHHLSMILTAHTLGKPVSVLVEFVDGTCFGRVTFYE